MFHKLAQREDASSSQGEAFSVKLLVLDCDMPQCIQINLILLARDPLLDGASPVCWILCPPQMQEATAVGMDGVWIGPSKAFFALLQDLAEDADPSRWN